MICNSVSAASDRATAAETALLPGADWSDSFETEAGEPGLTADAAAMRALGRIPRPVAALMRLRNAMVRPLGLKAAPDPSLPADAVIGGFPVIERGAGRVVLGLDDRHLDFRIVITVMEQQSGPVRLRATTLVRRKNRLGRAYLAAVKPFHKLIVPVVLSRAA